MLKKLAVVLGVGMLFFGACKKTNTIDDQTKTPVDTVKIEEPTPPPPPPPEPEIDSAAIREENLRQEAEMSLVPVYFDFDSFVLNEEARNTLSSIGEFLNKYAEVSITIGGHCDKKGSSEYNMALGEKRAKVAKDYLITYGVESERITTVSWGEEKPAELGDTEAAFARNRRDEFSYSK